GQRIGGEAGDDIAEQPLEGSPFPREQQAGAGDDATGYADQIAPEADLIQKRWAPGAVVDWRDKVQKGEREPDCAAAEQRGPDQLAPRQTKGPRGLDRDRPCSVWRRRHCETGQADSRDSE